jgi:hypothetical protein
MSGELGVYDIVVGNMGDRNDLALWWGGGSMIEAVAAVNNNTIAVDPLCRTCEVRSRFSPFITDPDDMLQPELVEPSQHHGYHLCRCSRRTNWARSG